MSLIMLPTNVSISWEAMVTEDYVSGRIEVEQFETEVDMVLRGDLPQRLAGGLPPAAEGMKLVREWR